MFANPGEVLWPGDNIELENDHGTVLANENAESKNPEGLKKVTISDTAQTHNPESELVQRSD